MIDLLRSYQSNLGEEDKTYISSIISFERINFAYNKNILKGETLSVSLVDNGNPETLLLEYGVYSQKKSKINTYEVSMTVHKYDFQLKKFDIFNKLGIVWFDLIKFMGDKEKSSLIQFLVNEISMNYTLLNWLKLYYFDANKLNEERHLHLFLTFSKFDFDLEINSRVGYYFLLKSNDKVLDYVLLYFVI